MIILSTKNDSEVFETKQEKEERRGRKKKCLKNILQETRKKKDFFQPLWLRNFQTNVLFSCELQNEK